MQFSRRVGGAVDAARYSGVDECRSDGEWVWWSHTFSVREVGKELYAAKRQAKREMHPCQSTRCPVPLDVDRDRHHPDRSAGNS